MINEPCAVSASPSNLAPYTGLVTDTPAIDELKPRKQWVAWNREVIDGREKKIPKDAHFGGNASHSRPATWSNFERADKYARGSGFSGVGFVLAEDDGITGIDLDDCIDGDGAYTPLAKQVIEFSETYCEVSPSGKGLRLLASGKIPRTQKQDDIGVELYRDHRYLTITGNHVNGTPRTLGPAPKTLAFLQGKIAEAKGDKAGPLLMKRDAAPSRPPDGDLAGLEDLSPNHGSSNAEVRDLLSYIPSDCGYNEWIDTLMSIHAATGGSSEGLATADWWSAGGGELYNGSDEVSQKWASFRGEGVGSGTLAAKAARYGADLSEIARRYSGRATAQGSPAQPASTAQPSETPWPDPQEIKSTLPSVMKFEQNMLPPVLSDYVFDVEDRQQSHADFVAVTAACGLAAIVGNSVRVAPKQYDDWIVVPNLWGAIIGPPSAMKTPAMKPALAPLYAIEEAMKKEWEEQQSQVGIDDVLGKLNNDNLKKEAAKAVKDGNTDEARDLLEKMSKIDDPIPLPMPRVVVNDSTVEKLGELLNENPRGLFLVRDELPGFLSRMQREEYQSERGFYLESFNGDGRFTFDRIGRGTVHVDNCTLSIVGGLQPSRLSPLVRNAVTGANDDGLIQRFQLAVWPDEQPGWKWIDRYPDGPARKAFNGVFEMLHKNRLGTNLEPTVFHFDPEAQDAFQGWWEDLHKDVRNGEMSETMQSHLLKMPKTIASLALIFELIRGPEKMVDIGLGSTSRAIKWAKYLRSHAMRIYSSGNVAVEKGAKLVLERRDRLPDHFTVRHIQRKDWAGMADKDTISDVIEVLVDSGYCREVDTHGSSKGGRPSTAYEWNPRIKKIS